MAKPSSLWLPAFLRFCELVRIQSKDHNGPIPIKPYEGQIRFLKTIADGLDNDIHHFTVLKSRQLGMCLDPETKILKADLTWVRIGDIRPGDELVAVDESPPGGVGNHRKMRTAVVESTARRFAKAFRISFDDGRSVICTDGHRWMSRNTNPQTQWRTIQGGYDVGRKRRLRPGLQIRWITKPWGPPDFEDGWFSGMLDGEGSMSNDNRSGTHIMVCQKKGAVWDRAQRYAESRGYAWRVESDLTQRPSKFGKDPCPKLCFSRTDEVFRIIGQTRPTRFLGNWRWWEGRELPGKRSGVGWSTITSIDELDVREMVDLQTSTKTFIAEGFVSHNSTIMLALDAFWAYMHPGTQGALVFDNEKNLDTARQTLTQMLASLPRGYRISAPTHNRNGLILSNGSRLQYLSAGKGKNAGLGRSRALSFIHASEISSFGDPKGLDSLRHAMSTNNPDRLYCFESTALGYNVFYDMWEEAKADPRQRAIFIGWWSKDTQRFDRESADFEKWWGESPHLDAYEAEAQEVVRREYGYEITEEQWAWFRRESAFASSEESLHEEQAGHEYEAFQATGRSFFNLKRITEDMDLLESVGHGVGYTGYRYSLGNTFNTLKFTPTTVPDEVELKVWEEPYEQGVYVIGADPAYGSDDTRDRSTIEVWRCYADRLVQVAEYNTPIPSTRQVAWVLAHLAGSYGNCVINLEVNGPGGQVMNELQAVKYTFGGNDAPRPPKGLSPAFALDQTRHYLYHRPDSPGTGFVYGWQTTFQTKPRMLNALRDAYMSQSLIIRSMLMLDEMKTFVQEDDKYGASGRNKDDRVIATALAVYAWQDVSLGGIQASLQSQGRTFERERQAQSAKHKDRGQIIEAIVQNHFESAARWRADAELKSLLEG